MGTITLTNLPQFVEQPGRIISKAIGQLDRMTVPFIGPWYAPIPFQEESPDTIYPLMFCTGYSENLNGALNEVTVTYEGVAVTSGKTPYYTEPLLSITPVSGSRDFQQPWSAATSSATVTNASPGPGGSEIVTKTTVYFYSVGTQRINVRYIGSSVAVRYQCIPQPLFLGPHYTSIGLPNVTFAILSAYAGEIAVTATGVSADAVGFVLASLHIPPVPPPLIPAFMGMRVTQRGKWYEVEETYAPTF